MLKLIQLGMTFVDSEGSLPSVSGELCVWQFNFRYYALCASASKGLQRLLSGTAPKALWLCREFKLSDDMYAQDSIELLKQSGIDFAQNEKRGIDVSQFGELLMTSGIVLNDEVQ